MLTNECWWRNVPPATFLPDVFCNSPANNGKEWKIGTKHAAPAYVLTQSRWITQELIFSPVSVPVCREEVSSSRGGRKGLERWWIWMRRKRIHYFVSRCRLLSSGGFNVGRNERMPISLGTPWMASPAYIILGRLPWGAPRTLDDGAPGQSSSLQPLPTTLLSD